MRQALILLGMLGVLPSQASAFDARITVTAINATRTTYGSGPISDEIRGELGFNTGTATAAIDETGVRATAEFHAEDRDQLAWVGSEGVFDNYLTIVPRQGFTGTHASVEFPITVEGSMIVSCRSQADVCGSSIWVRAYMNVGLLEDFSVSQVFNGNNGEGCTDPDDPWRCLSLLSTGTLQGSLPVNRRLRVHGVLAVEAAGIANSQFVDGGGQSSFWYAGFSNDEVDIIWDLTPTAPPP